MSNAEEKLKKISDFIEAYVKWSQDRGKMYGTVSQLESNWKLLDHIFFIINDLHEDMNELDFSVYLKSKGYGARNAAMVIDQSGAKDPYSELNKLWNEYKKWRNSLISRKKEKNDISEPKDR